MSSSYPQSSIINANLQFNLMSKYIFNDVVVTVEEACKCRSCKFGRPVLGTSESIDRNLSERLNVDVFINNLIV